MVVGHGLGWDGARTLTFIVDYLFLSSCKGRSAAAAASDRRPFFRRVEESERLGDHSRTHTRPGSAAWRIESACLSAITCEITALHSKVNSSSNLINSHSTVFIFIHILFRKNSTVSWTPISGPTPAVYGTHHLINNRTQCHLANISSR